MHSECLLKTSGHTVLQVQVRFLHLANKRVAQSEERSPAAGPVIVDGRVMENWEEGVERSVEFEAPCPGATAKSVEFRFPAGSGTEALRDSADRIVGTVTRSQRELTGSVSASVEKIGEDLLKVSLNVTNTTRLKSDAVDRDAALSRSLLSTHSILTLNNAEFISLLEPPDDFLETAKACANIGNFPVLVGTEGERDMLLCSPILLYDYPQIAPESAGDFFDATEMDEMLTLRVMTLTDQEKDEMRQADDRVRRLLERTEATAREQLTRTHGAIRSLRSVSDKP